MWIFLSLNNAVIMGTYSYLRGDLRDSVFGNLVGKVPNSLTRIVKGS